MHPPAGGPRPGLSDRGPPPRAPGSRDIGPFEGGTHGLAASGRTPGPASERLVHARSAILGGLARGRLRQRIRQDEEHLVAARLDRLTLSRLEGRVEEEPGRPVESRPTEANASRAAFPARSRVLAESATRERVARKRTSSRWRLNPTRRARFSSFRLTAESRRSAPENSSTSVGSRPITVRARVSWPFASGRSPFEMDWVASKTYRRPWALVRASLRPLTMTSPAVRATRVRTAADPIPCQVLRSRSRLRLTSRLTRMSRTSSAVQAGRMSRAVSTIARS